MQVLSEKEKAQRAAIHDMFAGIANRYDLLNHTLSLNIDKRWRRRVSAILKDILANPDADILDIACGTGDLAIELASKGNAAVTGTDFCRPMLEIAAKKLPKVALVEADAMALPFADNTFDAVTIAFGLRNLPNFANGLREMHRILRPGGRLVILEFSKTWLPGFGAMFNFYFSHILPRIGGAVSRSRSAYEYLPDSVSKFPDQQALAALVGQCGFSDVNYVDLTGGIAAVHTGTKA